MVDTTLEIQRTKSKDRSAWIKNLSSVDISNDILHSLALGHKHGIHFDKSEFPIDEYICDIECKMPNIDEKGSNRLGAKIVNLISNYKTKLSNIKPDQEITKVLSFIKQHKDLVITRADKGNVTVIMDTDKYKNSVKELLKDKTIYIPLRSDYTSDTEKRNNE